MTSWRDRKQSASWRGVPFHVDSDELSGGRRGQVHEYPQRDKPYVEDLGRKARKFSITAFLIGSDYMDRRDALLAELEKEGSGTLIHPEYGSLTVSLDPESEYRVSHSRESGGYCSVQMLFVESGDLTFPSSRTDTAARSWSSADGLDSAAAADFAKTFTLSDWPDFIADGALDDINDALDVTEAVLSLRNLDIMARLRSGLSGLIAEPLALATRIQALFQSFGGDDSNSATAVLARAAAYQPARLVVPATASRKQEAANQTAIGSLFRRAALAQASRAASVTAWTVRDDALSVRETLMAQYRAEEDVTLSNDTFQALSAARLATVQDLAQRAKPLPQLREITPPGPVPALVLSYDLYETADREAEIVARNRVAHPGFVPRTPLLVTAS